MTIIKITYDNRNYIFGIQSSGHSEHNLCITATALINAVLMYGEEFSDKNYAYKTKQGYAPGNIDFEIKFINKKLFKRFLRGIEAVITEIKYYSKERPDEIKLKTAYVT